MNGLETTLELWKIRISIKFIHSQYTVHNSIDTVECHALIDRIHKTNFSMWSNLY